MSLQRALDGEADFYVFQCPDTGWPLILRADPKLGAVVEVEDDPNEPSGSIRNEEALQSARHLTQLLKVLGKNASLESCARVLERKARVSIF